MPYTLNDKHLEYINNMVKIKPSSVQMTPSGINQGRMGLEFADSYTATYNGIEIKINFNTYHFIFSSTRAYHLFITNNTRDENLPARGNFAISDTTNKISDYKKLQQIYDSVRQWYYKQQVPLFSNQTKGK